MARNHGGTVLLDCYTDEPSGLGVPPYIGTYPRYLAGWLIEKHGEQPLYLTIDDVRSCMRKKPGKSRQAKTDIRTYNLTSNSASAYEMLRHSSQIIAILGVHTPGKYLSAVPGTLSELSSRLAEFRQKVIVSGPCVYGTQVHGGRHTERALYAFKLGAPLSYPYRDIAGYSLRGASLVSQIPDMRIAEIETGRGCPRIKGCSFCTEPIKSRLEFRELSSIVDEVRELRKHGIMDFRLGKQSCFYSYPDPVKLLKEIRKIAGIRTLHIDNVNPAEVVSARGVGTTKAICTYCTPGNVAAFGAETFDPEVFRANNLNSSPETTLEAVRIINRYGSERGENGLPRFLPGINILLGLKGETKKTLELNFLGLRQLLDSGLMIRRINIRQVVPFKGTELYSDAGNRFIRKNKRHYWSWRKKIRREIDLPMLRRVAPEGTIIREARSEIHDGNTTFCRQIGTYPLIVGVRKRLELRRFFDIKVTGHMLRSITGEIA